VGITGRATRLDPRHSTEVVTLDAAKQKVFLQKGVVMHATGVMKRIWNAVGIASFAL
jgi:hypothetical protein